MTLVSADKLSKKFDDQIIFEQVSFTIKSTDHIGLVGRNGSGKTTLFELVTGRLSPDSGSISQPKSLVIDYIEQEKEQYLEVSLFDYVASARADLLELRHKIAAIEDQLAVTPDDERAVETLGKLQNRFETEDGFKFENQVEAILTGLGFVKARFNEWMRNFSGGEKNRAALARALAGKGQLILLDEPTNHLDVESTTWLEEYLQSADKAFVVVSHDRAFLQAAANCIWEVTQGKLDIYACSFEKYLVERSERRRLHAHRYRHQQEEIKRLEDYVRRNMAGQKTKQAQSKLKYLARIKRLPPPRAEAKGPGIRVNTSGRSYALVLTVDNVAIGYGSTTVAEHISMELCRGDKLGIVGQNGSGKTTLLKSLVGELAPISGDIKLGSNVDVAYFDQELSDLNQSSTVIDALWEHDQMAESGKIRSFLARFGFSGDDVLKVVRSLSGGEKTKLSLAKLLYHPANFIIFDEPTNHLDIDSREALEQALIEYDGSCLIVSHDRYFLDRVVNRIGLIKDGRFKIYDGNYSYLKEKLAEAAPVIDKKSSKSKKSYLAFKEDSKKRSRHKKELLSLKSKITDHERELEDVSVAIASGISRNDWEKLQLASVRKKELEDFILEFYATLEQLEKISFD